MPYFCCWLNLRGYVAYDASNMLVIGSEFESDEDLDLDEKDDFLEQEAGDQDDIGTEEELRDQVHRVHLWVTPTP